MNLNVLIIDNQYAGITEQSLLEHFPGIDYWIVGCSNKGVIRTALENCGDKITLVLMGGVVVELREGDLPSIEELSKVHLCAATSGVFMGDKRNEKFYEYVDLSSPPDAIDLNVFIINPKKWKKWPKKDAGALRKKRVTLMPRYMNHKHDDLIDTCVSPFSALEYGMYGLHCAIYNYVHLFDRDKLSVIERYAYRLDRVVEYLDKVSDEVRDRISGLYRGGYTDDLRDDLADALGVRR